MNLNLNAEGFIEAAGVQLEYRFWRGQTAEPTCLVLLHEGLGCAALWKDFPQRLNAATGLAVLAWSRAGYGGSSGIELPRPLTYMHDEASEVLPALLDAADLSKVVLVGHSDGASIAAIYAGQSRDERLAGLVLVAPHFFVEDISLASIKAARQAYETGKLRDQLWRYHGDNTDCAFWGWNRAWLDDEFKKWDITRYLPTIDVPILALQGSEDAYGTLAQIKTLTEKATSPVDVKVLDDCGHGVHRDQPELMIESISKFIAKHSLSSI